MARKKRLPIPNPEVVLLALDGMRAKVSEYEELFTKIREWKDSHQLQKHDYRLLDQINEFISLSLKPLGASPGLIGVDLLRLAYPEVVQLYRDFGKKALGEREQIQRFKRCLPYFSDDSLRVLVVKNKEQIRARRGGQTGGPAELAKERLGKLIFGKGRTYVHELMKSTHLSEALRQRSKRAARSSK